MAVNQPVNYDLHWDGDKPFYLLSNGGKRYLSPAEVQGLQHAGRADGAPADARLGSYLKANSTSGPGQSYLHTRGNWDPTAGKWNQNINWSNILSTAVGSGIGLGAANAFAGPAAGAASTGPAMTLNPATGFLESAALTGGSEVTGSAIPGIVSSVGGNTVASHSLGSILGSNAGINGVNQGVGALTNYFANRSANRSNDRAAQLEAQANAATLAFLKEQEATRHTEWQQTQEKNYQLYLEQQARLAPYRQMGAGSLAQLAQPIPRGSGSTLADLLR